MAAITHVSSKVGSLYPKLQLSCTSGIGSKAFTCQTWIRVLASRNQFSGHIFYTQRRHVSQQPQKPGFFGQIFQNIKQDLDKNKEMQDSLKKFRKEADKLEQSEALKKARQKYDTIESESSSAVKETLDVLKGKLSETLEEAKKSDIAKKGAEFTEDLAKTAKGAAETITKQTAEIGNTRVFKTVSSGVQAVSEEIQDTAFKRARQYKAPAKLKKRKEVGFESKEKVIEADESTTGMELHKDSRWYQSWQNFKDNNQYVNKFFDLKMKYDESDNVVIRASRLLTDKLTDMFGGLFSKTEMSEVLTEICKMDPNFDKEKFLVECEYEIIPNILEAMVRGDTEIIKDWCYEAPYNVLTHPMKQAHGLGYKFDSKVLDVDHVDLAMGKIMEQGPVLIISFVSQQILCIRDKSSKVIEGDPDKVVRIQYVWVLCRDQAELDPKAAWRLLDLSASSQEQWL
ncbi:PREDICTED: mitochondrial import inner membrane translocase subunit TIM44-like [Priapulus caudatus]|uniref:Mitochondrial import inner membrane translocase subunit TIM44 n=1 Tax=Priapulus caudatus TaxID=37621 RepID=A0ABM1DZF2_PRICU|nr:PREDICTED: mitochondrial import inner membrane translocase subunit TIM44-like [Priapulus caudatus]